jgi:hypothetical protein
MRFVILAIISVALISCKKEGAVDNQSKSDTLSNKITVEKPAENSNFEKIVNSFPLKSIPVVDSTNFDNVERLSVLKNDDLKELKLDKLFSDGSNFKINSRYNLSPDYKTISVTFNKGEMEVFTELLNFTNQGELIDHTEIAYDEIAESAFRKWSEISKDKIILTDTNYLEEPAKIEKHQFKILPTGKIQK